MEISLVRRAARMLLIFVLFASFLGPDQVIDAQAQGLAPGGEKPTPQMMNSQKMLPPQAPRVTTNTPAPFQGMKSLSPRPVESSTLPDVPARLITQLADKHATQVQQIDPKSGTVKIAQLASLPNLFPYQPFDWDSTVVLSSYTGTTSNSRLMEGKDVYIDWSVANGGSDSPSNFVTCLYLDYTAFYCSNGVDLPSGYYWPHNDMLMSERPAEGWHTITILVDVYDDIAEENESDNRWDADFYWESDPSGQSLNLVPSTLGDAWSAPVVLADQPDQTTSTGLIAGKPFYLNMAALNEGPGNIPEGQPFWVEVTIDNVIVYSINWEWGLPAQYFLYESNFQVSTELSEGWHYVTLLVDNGNNILESNENDNIWSEWLYWDAPNKANLLPYIPPGWNAPVQITSTPGIHGDQRLYVDRDTYFHFAYINDGGAPANHFYVNLLVDGVFRCDYFEDLLANESGYTENFRIPANSLAPGWHSIKLWLDDLESIDEYNEADNTWEADFYWETSSLPNLHPAQIGGWEDALVASAHPGTNVFEALTADQPIYIDWAIINDGWGDIPDGASFRTQIICDGTVMDYWDWDSGLLFGWFLFLQDYSVNLNAGWHYMELVTDATNLVAEASENDNAIGIWIYVGQAQSSPEIRVEPATIIMDSPAGVAEKSVTLQRSMDQIKPFNPAEHGTGAEITPPTRFITPRIPLAGLQNASLPSFVDHSSNLPPVGNQGSAGSCTAWATSYYYKSYQEGLDQGWNLTTSNHQFSPNFIWNQIQDSSTCGGTWPGYAFKLMVEQGDISLSEMPYSEDCHAQPTQPQLDTASDYRAENYGMFFNSSLKPDNSVIAQMKEWLASGDLIQISIPVTPEFDRPSGPYCMVEGSNQGESRGGHAITIVGYDDNIGGLGKKGFKIVNSWGTGWGCGGFAYLSYDWVKDNALEAWWMRDIRTGGNTFRDFTIHNDGTGALTVSEIAKQGQSTWLQLVLPEGLPMMIEPGASKTIQIAVNPAELNNSVFEETVVITSDDSDEPKSLVTITLNKGMPATPAPPIAGNPKPGDAAKNQPANSLSLGWSLPSAPAGLMYDVRLDTSNPPASVICNDITATACLAKNLHPNTTYFWRVVSQNPMKATLGPVWSFTTQATITTDFKIYMPILIKH